MICYLISVMEVSLSAEGSFERFMTQLERFGSAVKRLSSVGLGPAEDFSQVLREVTGQTCAGYETTMSLRHAQ